MTGAKGRLLRLPWGEGEKGRRIGCHGAKGRHIEVPHKGWQRVLREGSKRRRPCVTKGRHVRCLGLRGVAKVEIQDRIRGVRAKGAIRDGTFLVRGAKSAKGGTKTQKGELLRWE